MLTRREFTTLALSTLAWPKLLAQSNDASPASRSARRPTVSGSCPGRPAATWSDVHHSGVHRVRSARLRAVVADARAGRRTAGKVPREELRKWRLETPLDHFTRDPQEVRRREDRHSRVQLQLQRQLHRARDRPRLRDRAGARRRIHHGVEHAVGGQAGRAVRREAQDDRRDAQPFGRQESRTSSRRPRASPPRMALSKYFKINLDIGHFTARQLTMRSRTCASTTRTSRTCTSRIGSAIRGRTWSGARATRRSRKCCSC